MEFNFLSFDELAKNSSELPQKALEEKYGRNNIPQWRNDQLFLIQSTISLLNKYHKIISMEEMSMILTGLNLIFKKDIKNKTWWFRDPNNSAFHKVIDKVIGVTTKNILDDKSEQAAIKAYHHFQERLERLELYKLNINSEQFKKYKDNILPSIKSFNPDTLEVVNDVIKHKEKPLKEAMTIITEKSQSFFQKARNYRIDDNHNIKDYSGIDEPKNSFFSKKTGTQNSEESGEEFLSKITLGIKK